MATILVIDDDELVSRTLQRALKMYDYQVMTANSGIEGLQLARRHRPDLFILDIMMPGIDGYEVVNVRFPWNDLLMHDSYAHYCECVCQR